jgi:uncharacterized protein YndB with AHSA1/START domain
MVDILHKIEAKASQADTWKALATREGLAGWWTSDTRGDPNEGGILEFYFNQNHMDMKVIEVDPGKHVVWQVVGGPDDWMGTKISFDLSRNGDLTKVLFKHQGWKQESEHMSHCSTKWATFMLSLKSLVETGKGAAFPNDVYISGTRD